MNVRVFDIKKLGNIGKDTLCTTHDVSDGT